MRRENMVMNCLQQTLNLWRRYRASPSPFNKYKWLHNVGHLEKFSALYLTCKTDWDWGGVMKVMMKPECWWDVRYCDGKHLIMVRKGKVQQISGGFHRLRCECTAIVYQDEEDFFISMFTLGVAVWSMQISSCHSLYRLSEPRWRCWGFLDRIVKDIQSFLKGI